MNYEVEMKFPVDDLTVVERRIAALGVSIGAAIEEVDTYFSHPARDFRSTDEALRIRRKGQSTFITYKGPKIDATTKTRREIDLPLPAGDGSAKAWTSLLEALGFVGVGEVRKSRRKVHIPWQGREVEGSLDDVTRLGTFFELELVVEPEAIPMAKMCIASLADALGLQGSERRSYLELLERPASPYVSP
jgi:adenylate cyclase class 2